MSNRSLEGVESNDNRLFTNERSNRTKSADLSPAPTYSLPFTIKPDPTFPINTPT